MRQSETFQDSGMYETLASCRSGDKPTAAVKPLVTDKPSPQSSSQKPHLSDKPHPSDKPHTFDKANPIDRMAPPSRHKLENRKSMSPVISGRSLAEKPVPSPRRSLIQLSPDSAHPIQPLVPLYTDVKKDKAAEVR